MNDSEKPQVVLVEQDDCCRLAARSISACHDLHSNSVRSLNDP